MFYKIITNINIFCFNIDIFKVLESEYYNIVLTVKILY